MSPVAPKKQRTLPPDQVLLYFLHDLDQVEAYSRFLQLWCGDELVRYERYIHDHDYNHSECERYQHRRDMHALFKDSFPAIGRHTVVVYLFAALEDSLHEFCFALQRILSLPSSVHATKGKGLERVKTYLKATVVGFPSHEEFWSSIKAAQQTRDVLTHCLGYLNAENPKHQAAEHFVRGGDAGSVQRHARDQLNVNDRFISDLVVNIRTLYHSLLKTCPPSTPTVPSVSHSGSG
jgi:hypothetical protein